MDADRRSRSLLPREHGAWLPLVFPLATALLQGRPGKASFALASAAVCAFLAHEPLLVALMRRGARAAEFDGPRAARRLVILGALFAISGTIGLALAPPAAFVTAIAAGWLGAAGLTAAAFGAERGAAGQLTAALVLPAAAVPVALAGGVPGPLALSSFVSWAVAFTLATLAVRAILGARPRIPTLLCVVGLPALAFAVQAGRLPLLPVVAVARLALSALAAVLARPPARKVGAVGLSFAVASALSLGLFLVS